MPSTQRQQFVGAVALLALVGAGGATAAEPSLGGPMKHLLVTLDAGDLHVGFESGDPSEIMTLHLYDETYAAPADALNEVAYSGQYGWLAGGFISLPPGTAVWVELLTQTDGLATFEQGTYAPIFGTEGAPARWRWAGAMTHNWYAATEPGSYEAVYSVYVGDLTGEPDPGFGAGFVTLRWSVQQPPCAADLNGDGIVDTADLGLLIAEFGSAPAVADINSDGSVDTADLGLLIGEFGSGCAAD